MLYVQVDATGRNGLPAARRYRHVTPFTVSRALAAWRREGVLTKGRGKILLQKPELLVPM